MVEISVVIPCYNEESNIRTCIRKAFNSFDKLGVSGEVIVVDNNSTDKTGEFAQAEGAKVIFCKEMGYGNALRCGFENAVGKYIIMADGDDSYDFLEIPLFYQAMQDYDMVTGTRLKGNINKGAMPFLHRYLGTPVLTIILNCLYRTKISDSQCGMRMFKRECLKEIQFKTTGMEFASELFVQFAKNKFTIKEIPISLYAVEGRKSKLNPIRDGLRHLFYLISALHNT